MRDMKRREEFIKEFLCEHRTMLQHVHAHQIDVGNHYYVEMPI